MSRIEKLFPDEYVDAVNTIYDIASALRSLDYDIAYDKSYELATKIYYGEENVNVLNRIDCNIDNIHSFLQGKFSKEQ